MDYTPSDIAALINDAQEAKKLTGRVLSSTSKNEAQTHEERLIAMSTALISVVHHYGKTLEIKTREKAELESCYLEDKEVIRRDMASMRQERSAIELLEKELRNDAKRCKNYYFRLYQDQPK